MQVSCLALSVCVCVCVYLFSDDAARSSQRSSADPTAGPGAARERSRRGWKVAAWDLWLRCAAESDSPRKRKTLRQVN